MKRWRMVFRSLRLIPSSKLMRWVTGIAVPGSEIVERALYQ
jgi:hypothetical protein